MVMDVSKVAQGTTKAVENTSSSKCEKVAKAVAGAAMVGFLGLATYLPFLVMEGKMDDVGAFFGMVGAIGGAAVSACALRCLMIRPAEVTPVGQV